MKGTLVVTALMITSALDGAPRLVPLPDKSPLVTMRVVLLTGAAQEPAGQEGVAALCAAMLAQGGTRTLSYKQIVDAMFPMATSVDYQVDKEMVTFSGVTHVDNLEKYYALFRAMLLEPGWRQDDFDRLRDDAVNFLRVTLRGNNDEELSKEVLYNALYQGHPYGYHSIGVISSIQNLTLDNLRDFYKSQFTQANLILGVAGGYPKSFPERLKKDFAALPQGTKSERRLPDPKPLSGNRLVIVEKDTRSVAYSFGFPIEVTRGHPDYVALLVAQSYLGQHRSSAGRLYERMRQQRGLNYGDYAYIEYFPRGMFRMMPDPNLARPQQIFQVWIRPVEPDTAHFGLRLAMYELNKFVAQGMSQEDFERIRSFLSKYVNLLIKTKDAELGYAIDSLYYGIPEYNGFIKKGLSQLTLENVNRAIRKHLRAERIQFVAVARNAQELRGKILSNQPSPMKYNSEKPGDLLAEDAVIQELKLDFKPENVVVVPVDRIFEARE